MSIVIIHGPKGSGKTCNAKKFMEHFGCSFLVDEWLLFSSDQKLKPFTLILTEHNPPFPIKNARVVSIDEALRDIGKSRPDGGHHA